MERNPLVVAIEWLLDLVRAIPLVALHTDAEVTAEGIVLPGEDAADMLKLTAAPEGAVGVVLAVGPVRVWLGELDPADPLPAITTALSDLDAALNALDDRVDALEHTPGSAALTLGIGWSNTSGFPLTVSRSRNGLVTLDGLPAPGGSIGTTIATIPAGYRPPRTRRITAVAQSNKAVGQVEISTSGAITYIASLWSAVPTGYINLADSWEAV